MSSSYPDCDIALARTIEFGSHDPGLAQLGAAAGRRFAHFARVRPVHRSVLMRDRHIVAFEQAVFAPAFEACRWNSPECTRRFP
jgi:hypothetical protein